ncbi:ubiquinone biosynthesis O-methyltransferase-like [Chironomus tepperi]|uniref:ubiquinone biosynthesis O-methyltransferase-like n=1 Tax=Chironomus tepperi TaxID=113505 RepID=UPI00391F5762
MLRPASRISKQLNLRFLSTTKSNFKNVDENDLKHLGSFSTQWWDPSGPFKPLHLMNQIRVPFICDGLISNGLVKPEKRNDPDVLKGLNILEVGCGAGILTEALAKLKANMTALEPSIELLEAGRDHLKGQSLNIEYISELIEEHSIDNAEKYDAVIASEVVEHVPGQKMFIQEMTKCLKPNGSIFITTPNRTFISWLLIKFISEYVIKIIPKGTHDWKQFIKPSEVTEVLNEKDCDTVLVRGIFYNPFSGKFRFLKYDGISYVLHAVKQDIKQQN